MALDQEDVDGWEYNENGEPVPQEKEMSFIDHLEELRWHVMRSLVAIVVCGIGLFVFREWYFRHILFGTNYDDFPSYQFFCQLSEWIGSGDALCMTGPNVAIQATEFGEMFITSVKMAFVGGFVLAFPYVFYEAWSFIRPGLYKEEQRATRWVIVICSFLFFTGIAFGYFIIAPFGTNFLMGFEVGGAVNQPKVGSMISFMVMFTLPAALIFELPVLVHFLARFGMITAEAMRKYRKHSIIGILILASLLTPPDVVTQVLIALPLWGLYEVSIFVARKAQHRYEAELEDRPVPVSGPMISPWLHLTLILAALAGGVAAWLNLGMPYGLPIIGLGLLLLLLYLRFGSVAAAAFAIQEGKHRRGEKILRLTASPRTLGRTPRARYYLNRSKIALDRGKLEFARVNLELAKKAGASDSEVKGEIRRLETTLDREEAKDSKADQKKLD